MDELDNMTYERALLVRSKRVGILWACLGWMSMGGTLLLFTLFFDVAEELGRWLKWISLLWFGFGVVAVREGHVSVRRARNALAELRRGDAAGKAELASEDPTTAAQPEPEPLPPGVVALREIEGSPMLVVGLGDGTLLMMDRDTFDYRYGESKLPDPARRDLEELLPNVTRVRALSGGMLRGEAFSSHVLLDTSEPAALAAFRQCFAISEDPSTFKHCACMGGPTLELFAGAEMIATIGLQHGRAIRWARWKHDADLCDGQPLSDWMVTNGMDRRLLELLYRNPLPTSGGRVNGPGPAALSRARQRLFLAEILGEGNDPTPALRECEALLSEHPEMGSAYAYRGLLRKGLGDFEGSVADFSQAIEHGEATASVFFNRAVALDCLGLQEDAISDCTRAIAVDPEHENAYNSRGLVRMMLRRFDEASSDFGVAMRLNPGWYLPYLNRAQQGEFRADWRAAVADYDIAIKKMEDEGQEHDSMLAKAYWNRGHARRELGDRAGGDADQRTAVAKDPDLGSA